MHSSNDCEAYALQSSGEAETVLFLLRNTGELEYRTRRLNDWFSVQSSQILSSHERVPAQQSPPNTSGFLLTLLGRRIEDENLQEAKGENLKKLFHGMLDAVDRGVPVQMFPSFNPSLTWQISDQGVVCPLMPWEGAELSEAEKVRHVAKDFYLFATGIDPKQLAGDVPALLRWSKFGGEELTRIVDRCLMAKNPRETITTLHALSRALGRASSQDGKDDSSEKSAAVQSSVAGHGLDRVAGMHALKELLRREVIGPVKNPEPFRRYGLSIPNGILLYGPPGCGKTYIARQLAEELGHYFVEIIPSELASPYIHQSVIKIRELFDAAAEQAPAVIFIDEFEALVPAREGLGGHQQYKSEEVNEFLAHLNSASEKKIFVIAATNQPDKIDPAVRRTGRLDKLIYVGPPDEEARHEMLALHLEGRPVAKNLDLKTLSKTLASYSASDIRFLVDEAARNALQKNCDISNASFGVAMQRVRPSITPQVESQYRSIEQRGL
ncbi:MAG: ATP-binding protein [Alphaproteobacteria bacterium]|nr:ATP-binding protein [Alphaproteobacteria bacterium]